MIIVLVYFANFVETFSIKKNVEIPNKNDQMKIETNIDLQAIVDTLEEIDRSDTFYIGKEPRM